MACAFLFTNEDYKIMETNGWSFKDVVETLEGYADEYNLTKGEVGTVFRFFGASELYDGVRIGCEDLSNMLGR